MIESLLTSQLYIEEESELQQDSVAAITEKHQKTHVRKHIG